MELHHADDHYKRIEDLFHIRMVTPKRAREALKNYIKYADFTHPSVQHLAFIGDAGVGKTALVTAAAKEFNLKLVVCHLAEMSDGQIMGFPFQVRPGVVKMCIDADYEERFEEAKQNGQRILLFFDEVNRAKRSHINALFNMLNTKKWASYQLPKDTIFVAAMNPPTEAYSVTELDMALMRRFIVLGIKPSATEWLEYADSQKDFHTGVKDYVRDNYGKLLGIEHLNNGKKFNCPASYESVARMLNNAEKDGLGTDEAIDSISDLIVGAGNSYAGDEFITYVKKRHKSLSPSQIISSYRQIQDKFKALEPAQATTVIHQVAKNLADARLELEEDSDVAVNLAMFLADLDERYMQSFIDMFHGSLGKDGLDYSKQFCRILRTGEKTSELYYTAFTKLKEAESRISSITSK